ncbi:MAG: NfeD family protein [Armatimonadota bacterium]
MSHYAAIRGPRYWRVAAFLLLLAAAAVLAAVPQKRHAVARPAVRLEVRGVIDPPTSSYVARGIQEAATRDAEILIIALDTPGGLVDSMREIVQGILASPVPVVTFVTPEGARAASAGALIGIASDFLVMSPTSNIGAAHPVPEKGEPASDKITNDLAAQARALAKRRGRNVDWAEKAVRRSISATADEALKAGVADFIAADTKELLGKLDGRQARGRTLSTAGIRVIDLPMTAKERFLHVFSNPNIALVLMMLAMYGLIGELSHPGAVFPGVVGTVSAILAFYSFSVLSLNVAGLLLVLLAIALFVADLFLPSHGVLTMGGVICLALGGFMLFDNSMAFLQASALLILTMAVGTGLFFGLALRAGVRAQRRRVVTGREALVGATAVAKTSLNPEGMVQVMGELWRASSDEPVEPGQRVVVVSVDGLTLRVRKET